MTIVNISDQDKRDRFPVTIDFGKYGHVNEWATFRYGNTAIGITFTELERAFQAYLTYKREHGLL